MRACFLAVTLVAPGLLVTPVGAQLALEWMVPAAANTAGVNGTYWRSDVSLHNPQAFSLDVVVQALESDRPNLEVPTLTLTLAPYETVNLWDALGPDLFAIGGTAALLAYADPSLPCDPTDTCEFLVTSRTYTVDPRDGGGEFGQAIPGRPAALGVDWWTYGYAAGILNDGNDFRCNVGAASWTGEWTTVKVDVQDAAGTILAIEVLEVPPFGHVQRRLATAVGGGSLVFYLVAGPDDALVFPYASVVDQTTGDPSFFAAEASAVGVAVEKGQPRLVARRPAPAARGEVLRPGRGSRR